MNNVPAQNKPEMYDAIDHYIGEIYDQAETQLDDVALIKELVGNKEAKVLEPFCGHGRILIPLVKAGYQIMGLDLSDQLLRILNEWLQQLGPGIQARASYKKADVISDNWPVGFDVVLLAANCFYELATPEEQEHCVKAAAGALVKGGYVFLDNNHMEGTLDPSWYKPGINNKAFPAGICKDGTQIYGTSETIWYDSALRLVRFKRTATIRTPDGKIQTKEWIQQKHPPSTVEMREWLTKYGFTINKLWGDRKRTSYTDTSDRAVFWATKE